MSEKKEKLFVDFPPISTAQWLEKITADLKGADFDKKLVWKTNEGFDVRPFYRAEDIETLATAQTRCGEFPFVRSTKKDNDWLVRQDIDVDDVTKANAKALACLQSGISSLGFDVPRDMVSKENIAALLAGIEPQAVELNFTTCSNYSVKLIQALVEYFAGQKTDLNAIRGSVNLDFVGRVLRKGVEREEWIAQMAEAVKVATPLGNFKVIAVNAYLFNNAGAFITQELGYALAWGNELMSRLIDVGVDVATAAQKIKFNFGVGPNYFMEMAKFRAARLLWAKIVEAYKPQGGLDVAKMNIFAQTSSFNQTIYDAHVNLLRTQTEAMSASLAGVDSLLVTPFDSAYKTSDDFSERIARNQQLLLKEECHFDKIVDPAGGSYYIETLTASVAQEAWKLFLETEEKGFYESIKAGEIQKAVNAAADKRFKAVAQRREILLGTNQYPNFTEIAATKLNCECACCCGSSTADEATIAVLNTRRLGEEFECLRLSTEAAAKRPKVFMLTIGNLAMRLARAQFSSNFFACAGYEIIDNLGFKTVEEGVEAAQKAGADIIVLCSSDDEYAELAPAAFKAINGKQLFVVAGAPACTDDLKAVGIEHFINVRSNVLETLKGFNVKLLAK